MIRFFENRSTKWYLSMILLVGFIARVLRALVYKDIKEDAVLYMNMARVWTEHGVDAATKLHYMIPPLWPWLLHIGQIVGIEPEITGKVIGIILGVSVILSVYVMCRTIFEEKSYALVGALLVAIHPYLIRISVVMLRDSVYIPLVAMAIALAMSAAIKHTWWKWALFGLVCGIGVMTRREGGEVMVFLVGWSVIEVIRNRTKLNDVVKRVLVANVVAFSVFFLVSLPVERAMSDTHTDWRVIPRGIDKYMKKLFSISEEDLLKTVGNK